ncbi:MAG: hypothetical protein AAGF33_15135 [Pseudomonadota bacterium]
MARSFGRRRRSTGIRGGTKLAPREPQHNRDWGKGKTMKIDKSKLLGFSNQADEKNDTMVGTKGNGSGKSKKRYFFWWW